MKLIPQLKAKVAQAVQTTMRIEGYTSTRTEAERQSTRQQMERDRVQVAPSWTNPDLTDISGLRAQR